MQLINHQNTIYLEFLSSSKIIKKSLHLPYNEVNLRYAKTTLLPIFKKLYLVKLTKTPKPKSTHQLPTKNPKSLSQICLKSLQTISLHSKQTTVKSATYAYKRIFDFLDDKQISHYTTNQLQTAIYLMQQAALSPSSIALIISYLNLAFKTAQSQGYIAHNPLQFIKKPKLIKTNKTLPSKPQIQTLLKSANGELRRFLYIAFYTGARSGEILALSKEDIDFPNSQLNITKNKTRYELTTPKNGSQRVVAMPTNLAHFLKGDLQNIPSQALFTKDYFQIYYEFKKLLKKLKFRSFGLHIARHCYTTFLLKNKISPLFIAHNLGHCNLTQINKTYSHYFFDKKEIFALEKIMNF